MANNDGPGIGLPKKPIEAQIDPIFQAAVDSKQIPGVAGIALDASGKVLFSKGYGSTTFGDDKAPKVTTKTPAYIFSCSKLVTATAALQLIEQQKLGLNDLVQDYIPEFAKLQVLDGFSDDGKPILREQRTKARIAHLFTHTAGTTYDFFNSDTLKYRIAKGEQPAVYMGTNTIEYFSTPLSSDAGNAYEYGVNIDWLGRVVEKISGQPLNKYVEQYITGPLGLRNTTYGGEGKDFFNLHLKDETGQLTPVPSLRANVNGEIVPGGQFLTSTAEDYAQFLLTILNNGTHPVSKVSVLKSETVKNYIFQDYLSKINVSNKGVGEVVVSIPAMSCGGTLLPGNKKGWSLGLMTNAIDAPNGRKAGSGSWAGLSNTYYWIDPASGKLGLIVGSHFPFCDKDSLHLFDALERAVYGKPMASTPGEPGSNFSGGEWWKDRIQERL